jgi:tetratricopeptide (TPR) repeat protein
VALALNRLGVIEKDSGQFPHAATHFEESLSLYRELDGSQGVAMVLNNMGDAARVLGNYDQAQALLEEALALRKALRDRRGAAYALTNLGCVAAETGNEDRAAWLFGESLSICREIGNKVLYAYAQAYLGKALLTMDLDRAQQVLDEALALATELQNREVVGMCYCYQGHLARIRSESSEAECLYRESYGEFHAQQSLPFMAECLEGLAMSASLEGKHQETAQFFGAAAALREALGAPLPPADRASYDACREACCAALGDEVFTVAFDEGRMCSPDEVLALLTLRSPDLTP